MNRRLPPGRSATAFWLYGLHPVRAALKNARRKVHRALLTEQAAAALDRSLVAKVRHEITTADAIARLVPPGAAHQGAALLCEPLSGLTLGEVLDHRQAGQRRLVAVLDQLTDPQNVGAILRSAAALGVSAVIVQDRHSPPQSGSLAKAASGALDLVPYVPVVNIARTLEELGRAGFWRVALARDGEQSVEELTPADDIAIVLGSEGSGIRRLVRERCDVAAYIPISPAIDSLNVSTAAAIAFYRLRYPGRQRGT
ncbi:MAG: RNA methyltransferase [Alphaproteobacteria bacterium]|nr:RNA methyltransferase [Alphaproteobacteria bacterium]